MVDITHKKKYLLFNWILFTGYGCIILFALYSSIYCWPTQGSVIWFLLIFFCPPFLYHGIFIGYALASDKLLHWKKSYRFVTLIVGFLLTGGLLQITQYLSLLHFKTAYRPFIAQIQANLPQPCNKEYFKIPQVQQYNASVTQKILKQGQPAGALFYNKQRFVLYFRAGSVDPGGSYLSYESQTRQWTLFHHNDFAAVDKFAAQIHKLTQCQRF